MWQAKNSVVCCDITVKTRALAIFWSVPVKKNQTSELILTSMMTNNWSGLSQVETDEIVVSALVPEIGSSNPTALSITCIAPDVIAASEALLLI